MKRSTKRLLLTIPLILLVAFFYASSLQRSQAQEHAGHDHASEAEQVQENEPIAEESHEGHDHEAEESIIHLEPEALEAAGVVIEPIQYKQLSETVTLTGTVEPHPDGEGIVGSLIEGRIQMFYADVGDEVTEDQPLCAIESPVAWEAEVDFIHAKAELDFVMADIERHRTLVAEGIGSKKELQASEAELLSAQAAFIAAKRTIEAISLVCGDISDMHSLDCPAGVIMLVSPVDGIVVERSGRVGMFVEPSSDLFHVIDPKRLRVKVEIPERYMDRIETGSQAHITPLQGSETHFDGTIDRIARKIDPETRTSAAFITVDNTGKRLIANGFVSVVINIGGERGAVLALPQEAISQDEHGDKLVYVEVAPHEYSAREVTVGRRVDSWVEILGGVEIGDKVVHQGAFALHSESLKGEFSSGCSH